MRVYERLNKMIYNQYDEIDVKNAYSAGFWTGAFSGGFGVFVVLLLVGLYINS